MEREVKRKFPQLKCWCRGTEESVTWITSDGGRACCSQRAVCTLANSRNGALRTASPTTVSQLHSSYGPPRRLFSILLGCGIGITVAACFADSPSSSNGRELAQKYCASCHLFPEPNLLDKTTWKNGALPLMRSRLGI